MKSLVHAPYIINIANTTKPETFELGVNFLRSEIERTEALGAKQIVLHPELMWELELMLVSSESSKD